jgi:hypothetical protein
VQSLVMQMEHAGTQVCWNIIVTCWNPSMMAARCKNQYSTEWQMNCYSMAKNQSKPTEPIQDGVRMALKQYTRAEYDFSESSCTRTVLTS